MIDINPLMNSIYIVFWVLIIIIPTARIYEEFNNIPIAGVFSIFWGSLITFIPHSPFAFIVDGAINIIVLNLAWIFIAAIAILVLAGLFCYFNGGNSIYQFEILSKNEKHHFAKTPFKDLNGNNNESLFSNEGDDDDWDNFNGIVEKILQFRYNKNRRRQFSDNRELEEDYHNQLHQWLKSVYPNAINDMDQRGSSRPDIVIGDICIEIKGPTRKKEVRDIGQKLIRYRIHYDPRIIVVLFYPKFDLESQYFCEFITGIKREFSDVVVIVENPEGILQMVGKE